MLRHDYLKVFAIGVAYFLAHKIAFFFPDQEKVIMLVWPAGGVSLAAFLLNPRRLWPSLTFAFYISGIAADFFLAGRSFMTGVGYMTANMVESIGCAWLILHWSGGFRRFTQVTEILALIAGTIFVNALSSCIGAWTSVLTRGASFAGSWQTWYISDGLGVLVMGPFIVAWINIRDLIVRFRLKILIEGLLLFNCLVSCYLDDLCANRSSASPSPLHIDPLAGLAGNTIRSARRHTGVNGVVCYGDRQSGDS